MKIQKDATPVSMHVSRYNGDEDITITITIPATETTGKQKVYVTMKPADFALALTGRSDLPAEMCTHEFQLPKRKERPTT